jgi:hypothetical protein
MTTPATVVAAPGRPSHRRRWIVLGVALGLLAAIGITIAVLARNHNRMPPPLGSHASDVHRIVIAGHATSSIPPAPTVTIALPDGTKVGLLLTGPSDTERSDQARIGIRRNGDSSQTQWHEVAPGDVVTDYGVKVKVLKVWKMPDWANNAVDVKADPAS